jgi:metal-dependent amidase/aminoacylase/carboxypeptidase family protein
LKINTFEHRSVNNGVSHNGHDDIAILCGLATELHFQRNRNGNAVFQAAEEDGSGAKKVLNDPKFIYKPDLPCLAQYSRV